MKLRGGTGQTATQVKGLSPVMINIVEADTVHEVEGSKMNNAMASYSFSIGV